MKRLAILFALTATLAACGGSSRPAADPTSARTTTVAEKTARFTLLIDAKLSGGTVRSSETGTLSFAQRLAHVYKLVPGGGLPQELIFDGPFTYSNANVQAALNDPSVKPWTKLDTRRLSAKERAGRPDELAHVRALIHLPDGIATVRRLLTTTVGNEELTQYSGTVSPARVVSHAPAGERADLAQALRNDYPAKPFLTNFWLDTAGRVRRVFVTYRLPSGTQIALDGRFSEFGVAIDTRLPPAKSIQDITP